MDKLYIVVQRHWEYNDNWNDCVGTEPVKAFKSKKTAEKYCAQLDAERGGNDRSYIEKSYPDYSREKFVFYKVVEISWQRRRLV